MPGKQKSPMSLRHRAFISRQTVFRPSVTSAKDAAGYFVGTDYLCPRNNPPLCILGSNLVVKTSWKEQPEQASHFGAGRDRRGIAPSKHHRRRRGSAGSQKNLDRRKSGARSSPSQRSLVQPRMRRARLVSPDGPSYGPSSSACAEVPRRSLGHRPYTWP